MKVLACPRPWLLLGLLLLVCTTLAAGERRYLEIATPEFTLISAVDEDETRNIAARVGMFRGALARAFGATLPDELPTRIYALDRKDWSEHAEPRAGVAGYFLAHPFSGDLLFDAQDESSGAYALMFHEYTHHILRALWGSDIPAFLDEGLAEAFGSARLEGEAVVLEPRSDYVVFLRQHDWLSFKRLLEVRRHDAEYLDHALAPTFYAQSWITVYRALAADPALGSRIAAYVRDLQGGMSRVSAAERLLGTTEPSANDQARDFMRDRKRMKTRIVLGRVTSARDVALRELDHRASTLELGELLLRMNDRPAKALALFEQARRIEDDSRAKTGAAWAHLQAGASAQAARLFDEAARGAGEAAPDLDGATAIALARGLFQIAAAATHGTDKPTGEQHARLLRSRVIFESALDSPAQRLEAVNGYVLASLALEMRDASLIPLAQSAYRLAPNNAELAVGLALLHELDGRKEAAREYWQAAARNTHAGPMRARILDALQRPDDAYAEAP